MVVTNRPVGARAYTSATTVNSGDAPGRVSDLPPVRGRFSVAPMSDRIAELVRQRALVAEQLAWLDRQISESSRGSPTSPPNSPAAAAIPASLPTASLPAASLPTGVPGAAVTGDVRFTSPDAETILEQYRVEPTSVKSDVRKGCLLYFALAFALVGLAIVLVYFLLGSR